MSLMLIGLGLIIRLVWVNIFFDVIVLLIVMVCSRVLVRLGICGLLW